MMPQNRHYGTSSPPVVTLNMRMETAPRVESRPRDLQKLREVRHFCFDIIFHLVFYYDNSQIRNAQAAEIRQLEMVRQ